MRSLRQFGQSLFDVMAPLIYLFTGPTLSTYAFGWTLHRVAFTLDGQSRLSWVAWLAAAPVLYMTWLVWLLAWMNVEAQFHRIVLHYRKPTRATPADGFYSWLMLNASLMLYLRHRFVMSLPLVEAFLPLQFLRGLVLRSYATSTHLGRNSLILGNLFDPDITEIGADAIIGSCSSVLAHSFTLNPDGSRLMITSPIKIGARSVIGGAAQIHPGVQIGNDAVIEPASYVSAFTQIGDCEVWGGNPARFIRMRTPSHLPTAECVTDDAVDPHWSDSSEPLLREIVAQALNLPLASITHSFSTRDTAAWDSLAQLSMAVALQKRFGVVLTNQESFRLRSMIQLREVVSRATTEQSAGTEH